MASNDRAGSTAGKSRGLKRNSGGTADWKSVDANALVDCICTAASTGGALRLGYSRDGGAYAVGIYGDGEPYTEFCKPSEDVDSFIADIRQLFEDIADSNTNTQRNRKQ